MKKLSRVTCLLLVVMLVAGPSLAAAQSADFAGEWVCVAVDMGDGIKLTEFEGSSVGDLMKIQLNEDGTLVVESMGESIPGTWTGDTGGVSASIDGQVVSFELRDSQLVNSESGVTMYLEKTVVQPKSGGLLSLLKGSKYIGKWVPAAVDEGDGVLKDELEGIKVADLMSFQINRDGTLVMTTMGFDTNSTWQETAGGINVNIEGESVDMLFQDNQLIAKAEGVTIYLRRIEQGGQTTAAATEAPAPAPVFAGTWNAVSYVTMGYTFDVRMLFPDGCSITLREDGTGEAFVTKDFTEKLTWSENDGVLTLNGSFVFSSPVWDGEKEELAMFYGSSAVSVVFQKSREGALVPASTPAAQSTLTPTQQLTAEPSPAATAEPSPEPTAEPSPAPTAEPVVTEPPKKSTGGEPLLCETNLFTLSFSGTGWVENEGWRSDRGDYSAVTYELRDANDSKTASIALTASSEGVQTYRDKMKALQEYALSAGKETLDKVEIGGIGFSGVTYVKWGWNYTEYAARVPESRITLLITVEQPENIGDQLQPILDSVSFKLPQLTPPNVDPPLPEDGAPYQPSPAAVSIGEKQVTAAWLKPDQSIILDSIFYNQILQVGNRLYVLAGKMLYAYTVEGDQLVPDQAFAGGKMKLDDEFEYLTPGKDGTLYVSHGIFNILSIKDGAVIKDSRLSGDLVMHPGGEWGISFWANADPMLVRASGDGLTQEPWVLSNLSDAAKRQGRFSSISCVYISDTRIYVAGTDAEKGDAQRVAVLDLEGKELLTFGAEDWMADDAFGSVTGFVEASDGILVLDGNYRAFKLFSLQGEFLGEVEADKLLGTDYPWLSSMVSTDDGVLVAASQSRPDESGDELLIFRIRGF